MNYFIQQIPPFSINILTKKLSLLEDESEQIKSQIKENTKKLILEKENLQNNKQNYFLTNQKKLNKKILDIFV